MALPSVCGCQAYRDSVSVLEHHRPRRDGRGEQGDAQGSISAAEGATHTCTRPPLTIDGRGGLVGVPQSSLLVYTTDNLLVCGWCSSFPLSFLWANTRVMIDQ